MPNNPRLAALVNFLESRYSHSPERAREWADSVLPLIDAVDPLRQPPSDEAVEAAFSAWFVGNPPNSSMLRNDMRRALAAAVAVMRGETAIQFVNCTIGDAPAGVRFSDYQSAPNHTDLMVSPEAIDAFVDANPPPDAIGDRLTALEARPQWTAEKERVVKFALNTLRRSMLNGNVATFGKWLAESDSVIKSAFPQPERVWPPADCLEKETCTRSGYCEADGTNCSHAGERANG